MSKVNSSKMVVLKRDGRSEPIYYIDPTQKTLKVINGLYTGVTNVELDNLAAEIATTMTTEHPDYAISAAKIAVSNHYKETKKKFSDVIAELYNMKLTTIGKPIPRGLEPSPSTLSYATQISLTSWTFIRTTARRNSATGTCTTPCGFQICSWRGWKLMETGPWCVLVWLMFGEMILKLCRRYEIQEDGEGSESVVFYNWEPDRLAPPTCFTRILAPWRVTSRTLGTIKCANLCTEIVEYSAPDEVAVCNLASNAVNMFVKPDMTYDFDRLPPKRSDRQGQFSLLRLICYL